MIYGLNFNMTEIPSGWAKRFRKRIPIKWLPRGQAYRLQGVATSWIEVCAMLHQAHNGRRLIHIEKRPFDKEFVYGVYTY